MECFMKNLSRWLSIIVGLTLIITVVGCSDPNNTPVNGGGTNGTAVPTVKELLENIPVSFDDYENSLRTNSQRTANTIPLSADETQGFTTSSCSPLINITRYGSQELFLANICLTVLKTDISNLEGFVEGENFTVPENFALSQGCLNEISTNFNFTPPHFEDYSWGTVKVNYENKSVKVFWSFNMINGDGTPCNDNALLLISGTYEDRKYKELETFFSYNFGVPTTGVVHFFKEGEKLISSILYQANQNRSKYVFIRENNETEMYYQNEPFGVANSVYLVSYSQYNNSYNYYIFDSDKYLVAEINGSGNSEITYTQAIPLHFINTNGKNITKSDSQISQNTHYYIDGVETNHISSKQYGSQWYPCYVTQNSNPGTISVSDSFTFTKTSTVTQAVQKIESMKQKISSSVIEPYYITDAEINSLETQCNEWGNSLS